MSSTSTLASAVPHNISRQATPYFVGREHELRTLHRDLNQSGQVTLEASEERAGLGKTELALQYANTYLSNYPGGICWLRGNLRCLEKQVIEFARNSLNLNVPQSLQGVPLSLEQQLDWCWQHWQPSGRVLIIIDEAIDLASCRAVLLALPDRFHIIITTLKPELAPRSHPLKLSGLPPEKAYQLLSQVAGEDCLENLDQEAVSTACHWFDYRPLAIKLLGAHLSQYPELSLSQVQSSLKQDLQKINSDPSASGADSLTINRIHGLLEVIWQTLDPKAQNLARLLSLLAPTLVPWDFVEWVLQTFWGTDYSLQPARQKLEAFNLIEPGWLIVEGLELHSVVRAFFQTKLGLEAQTLIPKADLERAIAAAAAGIARQIPQTLPPEMVVALMPLMPHLAEVTHHQSDKLSDDNLIWPFIGLGRFYQAQGLYQLAEPWWQDCLTVTQERLGKDHPDVAFSLNNLAVLYHQLGRSQEAETLYNQALELIRQLLGEDSVLAVGLSNLAGFYRAQNRLEEAETLYLRSLDLSQQQPTTDPTTVITNLNNLAELYRQQERFTEAEPLYQDALAKAQQALGKADPLVASCLNNLAELYRTQERYLEAETLHRQALKLRQRLFGKEHPAIATSLNNLAELYRCQGHYRRAEKLYVQALKMNRRLLGEDDPAVATSLNNLGVLYACVKRFDKAIALLEQALLKRLKLLGEAHPDTRRTLQNLNNVRATLERSSDRDG